MQPVHSILVFLISGLLASLAAADETRPNILFCLSDDQSWQRASADGDQVVNPPERFVIYR